MKLVVLFILLISVKAYSHVPALLLPIKGTPITSYFIGQVNVSRAIYSELTEEDDFFVLTFLVEQPRENLIQILTPVCDNIPIYEAFQPSAFLIKGDIPWKLQGESNREYLERLSGLAFGQVKSNYKVGERPQFYEEFGKTSYWIGGVWRERLEPGLYTVVVSGKKGEKGNFNISFNEEESWNEDLFQYVGEVLPTINEGLCSPAGFTGMLNLSE